MTPEERNEHMLKTAESFISLANIPMYIYKLVSLDGLSKEEVLSTASPYIRDNWDKAIGEYEQPWHKEVG